MNYGETQQVIPESNIHNSSEGDYFEQKAVLQNYIIMGCVDDAHALEWVNQNAELFHQFAMEICSNNMEQASEWVSKIENDESPDGLIQLWEQYRAQHSAETLH